LDLSARMAAMRTGFSRTFWVANVIELFERLAFYGSKAVLAVYLAEHVGTHLASDGTMQPGLGGAGQELVGLYGFLIFFLPALAGPIVDRYGFKAGLTACFSIFAIGYFLVATAGLPLGAPLVGALGAKTYVFLALLVTAIGGSLIKPCIVGTVARTTTDETKSLGYSIYYSLVNLGGAIGPLLALVVRQAWGFAAVLVMAALVSVLNLLGTLLFFKEPAVAGPPTEVRTLGRVLKDMVLVFKNARFITFLVIFSGFWVMFWQIFFLLPFYVTDVLHRESFELFETVDAFAIILLTIPVTALMKNVRPILAMASGFAVASASWLVMAFTPSVPLTVAAIAIFAIGEVMQAPRFYEYVASLAPRQQVGTFMGFAFLPVAFGSIGAGYLAAALRKEWLDPAFLAAGGSTTNMWLIVAGVGFASTVLMLLYDKLFGAQAAAAEA
jgi:POT family proton-dependent oligopeptide transporter